MKNESESKLQPFLDFGAVRHNNVSLAIGVLNGFGAICLNFLYCAICEDALLFAWGVDALDGAIREPYLLHAVLMMLLHLIILKLKNLQPIRICRLSCLSFTEKINNFTIWKCLFYIAIYKIHNLVSISICFTPNLICKNHLFFAIGVYPLNFTIRGNRFRDNFCILIIFTMVLRRVLNIIFHGTFLFLLSYNTFCVIRKFVMGFFRFGRRLLTNLFFDFLKLYVFFDG